MVTLPIKYSQFDSRWCTHVLGNNTDTTYNIYNYGCLLCCLAMVLKYYGTDINPDELNNQLKTNGGFGPGNGIYDWGSLTKVSPSIVDLNTPTPNLLTDTQMGEIKSALDKGFPVIVELDYNPKTVKVDMHFVVLTAYNPNDENDFTIVDPLGGIMHSLKDYLGWFRPSARNTINSYCVVSGPVPQVSDATGIVVAKDVFPNLVHGSGQWDRSVGKYMPERDPKHTEFEDLANVIGGIQSTATAANNQITKLQAQTGTQQAQITSLTEQLAHEQDERQAEQKTHLAQLNALKPSTDATKDLIAVYEQRVQGYQTQIKSLINDKQDLNIQNAKLAAKTTITLLEALAKHVPTFVSWYKRFKKQ